MTPSWKKPVCQCCGRQVFDGQEFLYEKLLDGSRIITGCLICRREDIRTHRVCEEIDAAVRRGDCTPGAANDIKNALKGG